MLNLHDLTLSLIIGVTTSARLLGAMLGSTLRGPRQTQRLSSQLMKENITMNHRLVEAATRMEEIPTGHNRKGLIACLAIKLRIQEQTLATLNRGRSGSCSLKGKNRLWTLATELSRWIYSGKGLHEFISLQTFMLSNTTTVASFAVFPTDTRNFNFSHDTAKMELPKLTQMQYNTYQLVILVYDL